MTDLETTDAVTISTGHLTNDDRKLLESLPDDSEEWEVYVGDAGFFVWAGEKINMALELHTSESLIEVLDWVQEQGYSWVRFDRDAPQIDALPAYDW